MSASLDKLLIPNSFILPEIDDNDLNAVISLVNQSNNKPLLAIAKNMAQQSHTIYTDFLKKQQQLSSRFKLNKEAIRDILIGFRTPLVVINECHKQERPIFDFSLKPRPTDEYIQYVVSKFQRQVINCKNEQLANTGVRLFTHCETFPYLKDNPFYELGTVASLTTFREYFTQITFRRSE